MDGAEHHRLIGDDELAALLREAIAGGATGLARHADTFLATVCAEFLVARMRQAGLIVCEPVVARPHTGGE
jgi:hypothetical protein